MSTRMDAVFAFKALSYGLVGLLAIRVLALSLITLRRDIHTGRPLTGMVRFASHASVPFLPPPVTDRDRVFTIILFKTV